jgi:tRNA(Ile)-lysidine synthase
MARLGPFEPSPALAVAVSGGADSLALALLAQAWAETQGGSVLALLVDHGLRAESRTEVCQTQARLAGQGIPCRVLALEGLMRGSGLASRARTARHAALADACAAAGIVHLLLGHHAADQAETLRMRTRAGSGPLGLAAMAALSEGRQVRLLRPLLAVPPSHLRSFLRARGLGWVEDPSNHDPTTLRARLRAELADPKGDGAEIAAPMAEARHHGAARAAAEAVLAAELAGHVRLHQAGWAVISGGLLSPPALTALLRTVAGRAYPAPRMSVEALAAHPRGATLAGARILPAGRAGGAGDWLVVREAAAMAPPVAARPGATWDGRFRLGGHPPQDTTLGALGPDAARLRRLRPDWPAALLATLPALRRDGILVAVPALRYPDAATCARLPLAFAPAVPLSGAAFLEM